MHVLNCHKEHKMEKKEIKVMQKILKENDRIADNLRKTMKDKGVLLVNLMSSPGSGKTSLIEKTVNYLDRKKIGVIEGDIQTTLDAERVASAGVKAYQINTGPFGGDCHLEAGWISTAAEEMGVDDVDLLFVENIGNLVCPAEFDVGAHKNVILLSVTEGEDKPLKYPLAFRESQLCIISKTDLLPYLEVDVEKIKTNVRKVNPEIEIIELSSKNSQGMEQWRDYLVKNTYR